MVTRTTLHCVLCGYDHALQRFGLTADGAFDPVNAPQHELTMRIDTYGGPRHLAVARQPVSLAVAYGMRDALQAALARVEADIAQAGGA
jgi:hypothetical protein